MPRPGPPSAADFEPVPEDIQTAAAKAGAPSPRVRHAARSLTVGLLLVAALLAVGTVAGVSVLRHHHRSARGAGHGPSTAGSRPGADDKAASDWRSDWPAFVSRLAAITEHESYFNGLVNEAFDGREVEWTGTVKTITRPDAKSAGIDVAMKPIRLSVLQSPKGYQVVLDEIRLTPTSSEWKGWKDSKPGDEVVFGTTLHKGDWPSVLVILEGLNSNAGQRIALVFTKGGRFVRKAGAR